MRARHIRAFGLLVGLVAVLGMASIAAGESRTDQQIGRQIDRRLSEDAFSNVNVSLQASVVSVKEIQNQVEVLPVFALDDRLRVSLGTNIYGNPLFWNDATLLVPPVHIIIVDNLHVTLSGVVFSEVEKWVAADIVR